MKRRPAITIELNALLAAHDGLARHHALWTDAGYAVTSGRVWRGKDGTCTVRLVYRRRGAILSSVTYAIQGLRL